VRVTNMKNMLKNRFGRMSAAALLALCVAPGAALAATSPTDTFTTNGAWSFVSAPNLHPPKLRSDAPTSFKALSPGYFLVANFKNVTIPAPFAGQGGPLILDSHLQPVWFRPAPSGVFTNNLREQTLDGKPALSWWQGIVTNTGATAPGAKDVVVDQRYRQVASITGADGWVITQHELLITGHDAWVTVNKPVKQSDGTTVVDSGVQEYDLHTGKAIYTWSALAHIPLSESKVPANPAVPRDAYHINSIQLLPGGARGRFLVSMRNTWGGYLVDTATGNIIWRLGGSSSSFTLPANAQFQWQHDIELHSNGLVSVFDDACCGIVGPGKFGPPTGPSRGLLLRLNFTQHSAAFVRQFVHPATAQGPVETAFQGNMQLQPNGNAVIGWGSAPFVSEFSPAGKLLLDAEFPGPDVTYRAYVGTWVGNPPISEMRQTAKKAKGRTTIYASWDGATQLTAWRVLGGSDARHLRTVATSVKSSFETAVRLKSNYKSYKVQALDSHGHVIGTSKAFGVASAAPVFGGY
jgi:hypothetical protein